MNGGMVFGAPLNLLGKEDSYAVHGFLAKPQKMHGTKTLFRPGKSAFFAYKHPLSPLQGGIRGLFILHEPAQGNEQYPNHNINWGNTPMMANILLDLLLQAVQLSFAIPSSPR